MQETRCFKCEKPLSHDEIALYKKLISLSSEQFMCLDCLSKYLNCKKEALEKKIDQFREMGCHLF